MSVKFYDYNIMDLMTRLGKYKEFSDLVIIK